MLSELQHDTLTEIFNMSIGAAAASLSEMVSNEVVLSVPKLEFMSKSKIADKIVEQTSGALSGVTQRFSGPISGSALLLFPGSQSLSIVRLLLQDSAPLEQLTEFEQEALCEIGNIILNSGLGSLADLFHQEVVNDLPEYVQGSCKSILDAEEEKVEVLFLQVDFSLLEKEVNGYLVYLLGFDSLAELASRMDKYILNEMPNSS